MIKIYEFSSNDLIDRGSIGEGNFGIVSKMEHQQSETMMAVKVNTIEKQEKNKKNLV